MDVELGVGLLERNPLGFIQAASLVDDAKNVRFPLHAMDLTSLKIYEWYHKKWVQIFFRTVVIMNMCLAFFEEPETVAIIPRDVSLIIDCMFLAMLFFEMMVLSRFTINMWLSYWNITMLILLCIHGIDNIVTIFWAHPRVVQMFRSYYLVWHFESLKNAISRIWKTIPGVVDVLVLVFIVIALYSIFCVVIFIGSPEGSKYFNGFVDGGFNLLVTLTTANYPDVMMPAYDKNRWFVLIFISYLLICLYFLMSLVLAVIYNKYRDYMKEDVLKAVQFQRTKMSEAFHIIDREDRGYCDIYQFRSLFKYLRPHYGKEKVDLHFLALDDNEDGIVSRKQFNSLLKLLNVIVRQARDKPNCFAWLCTDLYYSRASHIIKKAVRHRYFEIFMDFLIAANCVYVVIQTNLVIHGYDSSYKYIDIYVTIVFTIEMFLKMYSYGFRKYFQRNWNVFDCAIVFGCWLGYILTYTDEITHQTLRAFVLLRVLRLLRVVGKIQRFSVIVRTFFEIVPALTVYLAIQLCYFYIYAVIGMSIFGGKIKKGIPELERSGFGKSNYYANSFNNFSEGMVTLFELMVVNNWHVIVSGYVAVTYKSARIFFICFYIGAVVIILNIIIAFIIEAFIVQWEAKDKKGVDNVIERLIDVGFRVDRHQYTTDSTVSREWTVVRKKKVSEIMRRLFEDDFEDNEEEESPRDDDVEASREKKK